MKDEILKKFEINDLKIQLLKSSHFFKFCIFKDNEQVFQKLYLDKIASEKFFDKKVTEYKQKFKFQGVGNDT